MAERNLHRMRDPKSELDNNLYHVWTTKLIIFKGQKLTLKPGHKFYQINHKKQNQKSAIDPQQTWFSEIKDFQLNFQENQAFIKIYFYLSQAQSSLAVYYIIN